MPMNMRRFIPGLTATAGALMATAFLSSASSSADAEEFVIEPFGSNTIISATGMAPFDQTIVESGRFILDSSGPDDGTEVSGQLTNYADIFGVHNEDFVVTEGAEFSPISTGSVIDEFSFGSGFENVYIDSVGTGLDGQNVITDTFYTPFGDFNLPITIDAAIPSEPAAALAAVDPLDFTHLLAEFGSLF